MISFRLKTISLAAKLIKNRDNVKRIMAATMQTNRGLLFARGGAHNGHAPWKPLVFRAGQPLKDKGALSKSIAPAHGPNEPGRSPNGIVRLSGNVVTVGTNLHYATMMNWGTTKLPGGVLRPVNGKALRIPLPAGKKASDVAKGLAKGAKSGKSLARQVSDLEIQIRYTQSSELAEGLRRRYTKLRRAMDRSSEKEKYIFRKSVKIPARRFDEWTSKDQEEMVKTVGKALARIMK